MWYFHSYNKSRIHSNKERNHLHTESASISKEISTLIQCHEFSWTYCHSCELATGDIYNDLLYFIAWYLPPMLILVLMGVISMTSIYLLIVPPGVTGLTWYFAKHARQFLNMYLHISIPSNNSRYLPTYRRNLDDYLVLKRKIQKLRQFVSDSK